MEQFHSVCKVWLSRGPPELFTFCYCAWLWNWLKECSLLTAISICWLVCVFWALCPCSHSHQECSPPCQRELQAVYHFIFLTLKVTLQSIQLLCQDHVSLWYFLVFSNCFRNSSASVLFILPSFIKIVISASTTSVGIFCAFLEKREWKKETEQCRFHLKM